MAKFQLKSLLDTADAETVLRSPPLLETANRLGDWLVVTVPESTAPDQMTNFRLKLKELFGDKVLLVTENVKFFKFEEVEE